MTMRILLVLFLLTFITGCATTTAGGNTFIGFAQAERPQYALP